MPRTVSSSIPNPPPLPLNAVQFRAVLSGTGIERYVEYPPFASSLTPLQIAGYHFGGSREIRATKYGLFQQWSYMLPSYKWGGADVSSDGKQGKTILHISKTFWKYDTSKIQDDVLTSSAQTTPPVAFTPIRQLTYVHNSNSEGALDMPDGSPAISSPLFAGLAAFVHLDTPYPQSDGTAPWFAVVPLAYFRVTMDRCIDEETGQWVYRKYNPDQEQWQTVSTPSHYYLTLWLVVDDQRVRFFLLPSTMHPFDFADVSKVGPPASTLMEKETRGIGIVHVKWPSGASNTQKLKAHNVRGGAPVADKLEILIEHYVMHRRVPKQAWKQGDNTKFYVIPLSRIVVSVNGEWYEFDAQAAAVESYDLSDYIGYGQVAGMVTAVFPALRDGWTLARNSYSMPLNVEAPKYYVSNSRPAIAIAYPVCKQLLGTLSIPFSVGYRPPSTQADGVEMDVLGFMRPLFLSSSQAQDEAGRQMLMTQKKNQGVIYDTFLGDTFWANIYNFTPSCVISSMSIRLPGKVSDVRTIPTIDISPYVSFVSARSQFVPSEMREVQSVQVQLDAIDDSIVNGIVDHLMNGSGVYILDLELYSNAGGIAFSDFELGGLYHPCAYFRMRLPAGMEKQYRVQLTNRTLTLYAHDWLHFAATIPIRIAPFFDGWCWREAIRFLWELSGLPSDIWYFDDDNSRCQQGPYPKQLGQNGQPIGECPHYKLPVGPLTNPIMKFDPSMSVSSAIYQILTLMKRMTYYRWVQVGQGYELRLATKPFRSVVDIWTDPNTSPIAIITTGTYFDTADLAFVKDPVYGVPIVETGFLVIGQDLWGIRTVGVAAGFNPIGYPVIESRRLNVWGINNPDTSEQYMLKQQSPVFVAVPRPTVETDPIFVDPNAARKYLDYLSLTNYPSNRISAVTPPLFFPLGSVVHVYRGQTLYRKCYVAEVEHNIRRGQASTTSLGLRLVQNVI